MDDPHVKGVSDPPRIISLATAVPPHVLETRAVAALAGELFRQRACEFQRLLPVYDHSGIATRHSCMPLSWFAESHGWAERAELYAAHAIALLEQVALECLARADLPPSAIDAIVCVSTSGIATPSLEARLMERMAFRRDVLRTPLFGLGCAGGALGLARAAQLAKGMPGQKVLLLVVELCTLTFRTGDQSNANIVATALFGDGAGAALLCTDGDGPRVIGWGEHCWPDSLDVMGWRIEEDGMGVIFSRDIPCLVRFQFAEALDHFLAKQGLARDAIDRMVFHPGGTKVLQALQEGLGLDPASLAIERDILRRYGNMSAATVLFVLAAQPDLGGRNLLSALGPGFTAGFVLLQDGQ